MPGSLQVLITMLSIFRFIPASMPASGMHAVIVTQILQTTLYSLVPIVMSTIKPIWIMTIREFPVIFMQAVNVLHVTQPAVETALSIIQRQVSH
jgi:hypothetical protein